MKQTQNNAIALLLRRLLESLGLYSILKILTFLGRRSSILMSLIVAASFLVPGLCFINTASAATLTLEIDQFPTLTILPKTDTGDFAKSSDSTISVTTDHSSGYTLSITASSSTDLVNGSDSTKVISSIGSATSETDFKAAANASTYNNRWGYLPSKLNSSANTSFLPSPGTVTGDIIDITDVANNVANTYTLAIGARVNLDTPVGAYSNTFVISAVANVSFLTINYNANNSYTGSSVYFGSDTSSLVNTMDYDAQYTQVEMTEAYSHTPNISDDGTVNDTYDNALGLSQNTNEIITIPGASKLGITITYETEGDSWDWTSFWAGSYPSYTAESNYSTGVKCDGNTSGIYGGTTKTTKTCEIDGDTVTFSFHNDSYRETSIGTYGYYAVITGYDTNGDVVPYYKYSYVKTAETGTYTTPTIPSGMNFVGWATTDNATTAEYTDESAISSGLQKINGDDPVTLYPVYTSNVTIKTATGISSVYIREVGSSTDLCSTFSTSGTVCALTTGKAYNLYASVYSGHIFASWTKTGVGTLGSTSSSTTTFTPGAGATTLTPSTNLRSYAITVNFVGGVSSVTFTNATYGTQTVSSSGGTVPLKYNQQYNITVTLNNGNYFVSWEKVSGSGTIGNTSTMNTYFTPSSGAATLRITAANTRIKTADGIDSVTVSTTGGSQVCTTTDATTGVYCNLTLGTTYNITATTHQGYTFSSWSHTGSGTIGSSTSSTTTFTPAQSSAIDVITPSATGNPYTVTIVFGNANVTSVTVDGETFTTSGGTKTLTAGTAYTISGTTDLSAVSFTSSANGVVAGNTFTLYGDATLTAEGLSKIYMQGMNGSLCTSTPLEVYDSRGGEQAYMVARLADGKCWMLQNLNLPGGTALSADDTDVTSTYISGFTTQGNLTKSGNTIVLPASATRNSGNANFTDSSQFSNNSNADVYNSGNTTICNGTPCNSYYTWIAATLGGKQANGSTNQTSNGYNAAASICPKGWRLPTSTTSNADVQTSPNWKTGDWYALATAYGADLESSYYQSADTFYNNAGPGTTPNFLLAGYCYLGSTFVYDNTGPYWSATSCGSSEAYALSLRLGFVSLAGRNSRSGGFSVRCVLSE